MNRRSGKQIRPLSKQLSGALLECFSAPDRVLFLDIETTGLSHYYDEITIIGWSLGGGTGTFIKGDNPAILDEAFTPAIAMVTFNGIRFDRKFLQREHPTVGLPSNHIDLMYLARRVGLTGGQKAIEKELGLNFRDNVGDIDGFAAVLLWHQYLRGDISALRKLILYNKADIAGMGAIFDQVIDSLPIAPDLFSQKTQFEKWAAPGNWREIKFELDSAPPIKNIPPTFDNLFAGKRASKARIVGIDLTGSEARPSGWCFLNGKLAETDAIKTDSELVTRTLEANPDLVSIDSPLSLPAGRITVFDDDPGRQEFGIMRQCERELKRRGVNVYPSLLPSMQKLTARGILLATELRKKGVPVIESYPGAAQDIMRIPRKGAGVEWLKRGLAEFGICGDYVAKQVTHDELDAITSALVGTFHLGNMSEELGNEKEAPLIIPDLSGVDRPWVIGISGAIAAGKTTLARIVQKKGFYYTRFSLIIDEIIEERGLPRDRKHRQSVGTEIYQSGRQRELGERTIGAAQFQKNIVIDGMRFPEDHALMAEKFGYRFIHIHVTANEPARKARFISYQNVNEDPVSFETAAAAETEQSVESMGDLANTVIHNNHGIEDFEQEIHSLLDQLSTEKKCLFQSS